MKFVSFELRLLLAKIALVSFILTLCILTYFLILDFYD